MIVPSSMVESTLARLRKYLLRAKVKLENQELAVFAAIDVSLDVPTQTHCRVDERSYVKWPGAMPRVLCVAPASAGNANAETAARWHGDDIAAGLPQVYPQTHEAFVAQMLNLDVLGGISFEKGCYTGQEIIARTHFRGAIKRRMFRFGTDGAPPEPGTRIVVGDHHAGDVVDAVATGQGSELLAVVNLTQVNEPLRIASSAGAPLTKLPLPYQV